MFPPGLRTIEAMLAARGNIVGHENIRRSEREDVRGIVHAHPAEGVNDRVHVGARCRRKAVPW